MRAWDDPVLLVLGPLEIRWYGLILAFSILAATGALALLLRRRGEPGPWEQASTLAVRLVPAGLVGARLAFVLQNWPVYSAHPLRMLAFWDGGLSLHGALLAGLGALAWQTRSPSRFLARADLLLTVLPLAQAVGRWGNLLNRELLGYPTLLPWGLYVEPAYRPAAFATASTFHPVFLYESLADLALFAFLWRRAARGCGASRRGGSGLPTASSSTPPSPGSQAALYLAGYGAIRMVIEFFRIGTPMLLGLTPAQWISALAILAGLLGWRRWSRTSASPGAAGR